MVKRGGLRATIVVAAAMALAGCGYHDENPEAARVVAQAYASAYPHRDAATICRVIFPTLAATFASLAHGSCDAHIAAGFTPQEPTLRLGPAKVSEATARVDVVGEQVHYIELMKSDGVWYVVSSWELR
jgi:hypothetical protein